jgi:RNase P/RNase MRP subunit p29
VLTRLTKADFHGAIVRVAQSKCPSLLGLEGIVLQETENTFVIVTPSNTFKSKPKMKKQEGMKREGRGTRYIEEARRRRVF